MKKKRTLPGQKRVKSVKEAFKEITKVMEKLHLQTHGKTR